MYGNKSKPILLFFFSFGLKHIFLYLVFGFVLTNCAPTSDSIQPSLNELREKEEHLKSLLSAVEAQIHESKQKIKETKENKLHDSNLSEKENSPTSNISSPSELKLNKIQTRIEQIAAFKTILEGINSRKNVADAQRRKEINSLIFLMQGFGLANKEKATSQKKIVPSDDTSQSSTQDTASSGQASPSLEHLITKAGHSIKQEVLKEQHVLPSVMKKINNLSKEINKLQEFLQNIVNKKFDSSEKIKSKDSNESVENVNKSNISGEKVDKNEKDEESSKQDKGDGLQGADSADDLNQQLLTLTSLESSSAKQVATQSKETAKEKMSEMKRNELNLKSLVENVIGSLD